MKKMHFYNFILDFLLLVYFALYLMNLLWCMWAVTQESLSLGFLTKQDSKQPPQLQRLARKLKFRL